MNNCWCTLCTLICHIFYILVDIFTTGHGKEPILIDRSPPLAGYVIDGDRLHNDLQFQSDSKPICAQWLNFYDPESGIDRYFFFHLYNIIQPNLLTWSPLLRGHLP